MGGSVSRNINWRDEPATFQGADPEIFDKYIDEDRPVRGKLFLTVKKCNSKVLFMVKFLKKIKAFSKSNVFLCELIIIVKHFQFDIFIEA